MGRGGWWEKIGEKKVGGGGAGDWARHALLDEDPAVPLAEEGRLLEPAGEERDVLLPALQGKGGGSGGKGGLRAGAGEFLAARVATGRLGRGEWGE